MLHGLGERKGMKMTEYVIGECRHAGKVSAEMRRIMESNSAAVEQLPAKGPIYVLKHPCNRNVPEE